MLASMPEGLRFAASTLCRLEIAEQSVTLGNPRLHGTTVPARFGKGRLISATPANVRGAEWTFESQCEDAYSP